MKRMNRTTHSNDTESNWIKQAPHTNEQCESTRQGSNIRSIRLLLIFGIVSAVAITFIFNGLSKSKDFHIRNTPKEQTKDGFGCADEISDLEETGGELNPRQLGYGHLFTSQHDEVSDYRLSVKGALPTWLKGTLIRNGPGKFEAPSIAFSHVFNGFAKLHSFKFTEGQSTVHFSSKFLETRVYEESVKRGGRYPTIYFDEVDPPLTLFEMIQSLYNGIDNTNVNVYKYGADLAATTESWEMYTFDRDTLGNASRVNALLPEALPWIFNKMAIRSVAHPMREYGTNATITVAIIGVDFLPVPILTPSLNIIRAHNLHTRELIASIPVDRPPFMHSFGVSQNNIIVIADPIYIDVFRYFETGSASKCLEMTPEIGTSVYVVSTKDGSVTTIHVPMARFHGHHINAFEKGNMIYVDVAVVPNLGPLENLRMDVLKSDAKRRKIKQEQPEFKRYVIDLEEESFTENVDIPVNQLVDHLDYPAINEQYRFKDYCFVYGIVNGLIPDNIGKNNAKSEKVANYETKTMDHNKKCSEMCEDHKTQHCDVETNDDKYISGFGEIRDDINVTKIDYAASIIVKKDLCHGQNLMWYKQSHYPSEPSFVPNPNARSEDDGVLLSIVLDGVRKVSYLLVLDARTFTEVSTAETPFIVPFTLHGWVFD